MPYRLTKIYTRKGDEGYTILRDERVSKDDLLVEAIGNIDELNAHIGMVASLQINNKAVADVLMQIQNDLFDMGGELHLPQHKAITNEKVKWLEETLDHLNSFLPPLEEFLLPRGSMQVAASHIARTVCRRAERSMVRLHRQIPLANTAMLCYLNRLSDLLFVIARTLARESEAEEILWEH